MAPAYYLKYPATLDGYITKEEFKAELDKINDAASYYWPCSLCFSCGYCLALCTLGLSFCFPNVCVSESYNKVVETCAEISGKREQRLKWTIRKK
jgi:hypothetical protein